MKLSQKVKTLLFAGVLAISGIGLAVLPGSVYAADKDKDKNTSVTIPSSINNGLNDSKGDLDENLDVATVASNIVNTLLYVIGLLAVIMMIVGGIMYTTSTGDQAKVTKAKNIIIYGLVGLIVAILAYAIVNFVLKQVLGAGAS